MVEFWILIILLCLLTTAGGTLIALRIQHRLLDNSHQEREAWQQAQESRQRTWEVRQGKHILDTEKKLADQLKDSRREWRDWNLQLQQEHQEWRENVDFEQELARLPHIEEMELTHQHTRSQPRGWRPAPFYRADLSGRDLSHRYLERADLREAQLTQVNLYMADLTGASLTRTKLQQAELTGANLSGADLRGANLSGANLLVADLHNAILHGANLTGARNLTPAQLQTAIYDSTTIIDSSIDITLPRIPGVVITPPDLLTDSQPTSVAPVADEIDTISASAEPDPETIDPIASFPEVAGKPDESANTPPLTTSDKSLPILASASQASPMSAEERTDVQAVLTTETQAQMESVSSARETSKKSSRKRSQKSKQATSLAPAFAGKAEETHTSREDNGQLIASVKEGEKLNEENTVSSKIIQLQDRTAKTWPLAGSSEQDIKNETQPHSSFYERSS